MKNFFIITFLILFSGSFVSAQLLNDAVAYFPFDGNVDDLSSSAISATNNGMSYGLDREGDPNESISNNGASNFVFFNDNVVKVPLPITLSAWVKLNAYETNIIFTSDNQSNNYNGYWIIANSSGNIGVSISGGLGGTSSNNRRTFKTNASLSLNTWQHLTVIIRAYDDIEVYIDCEKAPGVYHGTGSTNMAYSNTESRVGADLNGYNFNGQIDELAIWDRELTASEYRLLCGRDNHLNLTDRNKQNIEMYPNPVGSYLNIDGTINQYDEIALLDANGRSLHSWKNTPKRINLNDFEKGVYFVKVFNGEKLVATRKIIKY